VERCIVRANSAKQGLQRGIGLQSASTDILDCRIEGCKYVGADSQAIAGWNGPGPCKIINNYIEGAGENVLFGGADPGIADLVPTDITFKRNHCSKPLSWRVSDPSYAGAHWTVKNIFELKNARKVLVEGNIFENNWSDAQTGVAILFTPRNQEGSAPWCTVEDVTFVNNIVRNTSSAYDVLGTDNEKPSKPARRIKIQNNLMYNVDSKKWGSDGSEGVMYILLDSIDTLTIDHNTGFHTGNVITVDAGVTTGMVFTNNLHPHNAYGIIGSGNGPGNATLNKWLPKVVFQKNVLMGGPAA
jgi:hypothetical protein